jgi:pyridoxamine 5'-phosphate oxidase
MANDPARTSPSFTDPFSPEAHDPMPCFRAWLALAEASEPNDPNAMALATATRTGVPSVRMVLLKELSDTEFVFYTNAQSRKGEELYSNPVAALCFHWKSLQRQVRIEGPVTEVYPERADAYFRSRSRSSQISALASEQSRPLADRATLEQRAAALEQQYPDIPGAPDVPRPAYWTGFALHAERIEFWKNGPHRLHDRMLYTRNNGVWTRTRLYP